MRGFHRAAVIAMAAFGFASVACATGVKAPVAAPATYNWTGFYVGGYAGWGWGTSEATDAGDQFGVPWYNLGAKFSTHLNSFNGGGQIGYNHQFGMWVAGVEADIGSLRLSGSSVYPDGVYFDTFINTDATYDATLRGRLGVVAGPNLFYGPALVYVTGGAFWANFRNSVTSFANFHTDTTGTQSGWTLGGGVEYALDPRWSVKTEYLYYDAGTASVYLNNGSQNRFDIKNTGSLFRIGVNYRIFGQ